jgi:photosystem II stability/assembly factor-like uncharacterized protein
MIDGSPVLHIYVPDAGGPARYAMTAERLFRWTDGDWVQTASRADNRVILVDPVRPNRLFRGNHPPCTLEDTDSITLSKSTDGGNTWRAIAAGDNIRPLAIDPTLGDVIYGSDCGLTISTDGGETWREYYRARGHTVVDAAVVGETLLVLEVSLTGRGRLRQINVTVPENPELVTGLVETGHVFDLDADRERIVIGGLQGIIFSLDGGETWTTTREGLEAVTIETPEDIPVEEAEARTPRFGVLTVKLDPTHPQRLFAGTVRGLYISQDAGLTWDVYSSVRTDARIVNIQFAGEGNDIYLTTPRGVMVVPNP